VRVTARPRRLSVTIVRERALAEERAAHKHAAWVTRDWWAGLQNSWRERCDMRGRQSQQRAVAPSRGPGPDRIVSAALACGSIQPHDRTHDVSGAFGTGDSILVGERVRLRGARTTTCPRSRRGRWIPGAWATLSSWVARRRGRREGAHREVEREREGRPRLSPLRRSTIRPVLIGNIGCGCNGPKDRVRRSGSPRP